MRPDSICAARRGPYVDSYGALALGIIFGAGTGYVLFEDVLRHNAPFTTDLLMTLLVLIGALASGHMCWPSARQGRIVAALFLAALFVAGTFYCVTAAAGRNAVTSLDKAAEIHKVNDDRARIEADLGIAKQRLEDAMAGETAECASGKRAGDGPKCKGWGKTRAERQSHVEKLDAQLRLMAPEKVEDADLRFTAKVFGTFLSASEDAIFEALKLTVPFVKAAFCEIATLVFLGLAFGHRGTVPRAAAGTVPSVVSPYNGTVPPLKTRGKRRGTVPGTVPRVGNRSSGTVVQFPKGGTVALTRDEALELLLQEIELRGTVPSQDVLKELFRVGSKSTVSRWLAAWEADGHISRAQSGRCKQIRG